MTPDEFRCFSAVHVRSERSTSSDFRVERKAFASLEGPAESVAVVNLTSEQQDTFVHMAPKIFTPVPGGWGRLGYTSVRLPSANESIVRSALEEAWRNVLPKPRRRDRDRPQ
jgi:hypothetical protein